MPPSDTEQPVSQGAVDVQSSSRPDSSAPAAKRRKVKAPDFTVCTVFMSNNNRSMAAHKKLADAGFTAVVRQMLL
jgi:cell division septation protein DedD